MLSTTVYHKKHVEGYLQKHKNEVDRLIEQKYFLLCENCYWMASTLAIFSHMRLIRYKKCPICVNKVDRFLICVDDAVR